MRDIKFRAWNSDTKVMVDLYKITPLALSLEQNGLFLPFKDEWPLMQYTGLKDKNGKEIYEGDIVQFGPTPSVIEWSDIKAGFYPIYGGMDERSEVIGNIYENPELLEVAQ